MTFNKVTAACHKMVAPWPKMVAETKWQSPVYTGEGPSGADVVVGVWSCQPITADHVTGRGAWLSGQTAPEAAGKGDFRGTQKDFCWELGMGHLPLLISCVCGTYTSHSLVSN